MPAGRRGIGIAAVNIGDRAEALPFGRGAKAWVMQATPIDSKVVTINGGAPRLEANGALSGLDGVRVAAGATLPAKSIGFYAVEAFANPPAGRAQARNAERNAKDFAAASMRGIVNGASCST